jgi:DNA-binding NarL/FixJ family response regulator
MRRIRIMLADDHQILLDGLTTILSADAEFEVIGSVNNGKDLIHALKTHETDLIVMDLNMPKMDGLQTLEQLKRINSSAKIMILSNYNQKELVRKVQECGADGYVLKSSSANDLLNSIKDVAKGIKLFPSVEDETLITDSYFADEFLKKYNLTKREVEIIRHLAKGMSSKEICDVLHISNFTVDTHRRNILRKLNINNSVGVVNFAKQHGLIE